MHILRFAENVRSFLLNQPEVRAVTLCGSIARGNADCYSDIDLETDVSGTDNGAFLLQLPERLTETYPVIFYDYAPSLAPEKYVLSVALDEAEPFRIVDIACTAEPHVPSVSKDDLRLLNSPVDHTLKLFAANLKHFIRGTDCRRDIKKMYSRLPGASSDAHSEKEMLRFTYAWLEANCAAHQRAYTAAFRNYLESI